MSQRQMGPLTATHPLVRDATLCPGCRQAFKAGEYVTFVLVGPGDDEDERRRRDYGRAYNAVAVSVHLGLLGADDVITPEQEAAIRKRDRIGDTDGGFGAIDRRTLLAELDATRAERDGLAMAVRTAFDFGIVGDLAADLYDLIDDHETEIAGTEQAGDPTLGPISWSTSD